MHIYELENRKSIEEMKNDVEELEKALPEIHFPHWANFGWGRISGYKYNSFTDSHRIIEAYTEQRIAVVSEDLPEESIDSLQRIGYHVPTTKMQCITYIKKGIVKPEKILWNELRNGKGQSLIKTNLENLLSPILSSIKGVDTYRFAVYNPFIISCSDDIVPPYIEYDEIFSLQTYGNGLVDIEKLLEKIKTMPPERAIAISSEIQTEQGERHIPMIDFKSTGIEYWQIQDVMKRLNIPGQFLVDSGNSFHHHDASKLVNLDQFYQYADSIAEQPEIGKNWPWLSARQGFSLLRISPSASKPFFPRIEKD